MQTELLEVLLQNPLNRKAQKFFCEVWEIDGKAHGITFEQFHAVMEGATHPKRLTTLKELTNAAVFSASDKGSAITGAIFNLTAG